MPLLPSLAGCLLACLSPQSAGDRGVLPVAECPELEDLAPRWRSAMAGLDVPGFAVAVVQGDDVLVLDAFGLTQPSDGKPVSPDTRYYIASCTKVFLATLVAQLAERSKLSLDAPVTQYLPRFTLADPAAARALTVRDLLCHRPGLQQSAIVFNDAYSGLITDDRYYRLLARVRPAGETRYSNVHFTLLGRVVEAVTGRSWRDELAASLLQPLGMTRTSGYASALYADPDSAPPLVLEGGRWVVSPVRKTDRTMHAAGGLGTTARDLSQLLRFLIGRGMLEGTSVLSAEHLSEMLTLQAKTGPDGQVRRIEGFGLGWNLGTYRGRPYAEHNGGYIGAAAHISFLPEDRIGIAFLTNAETGPALAAIVSIDVYDRLLGLHGEDLLPGSLERARAERQRRLTVAPPAPARPVGQAQLSLPAEHYRGTYEHEDWGTLELRFEDGALRARLGDLAPLLRAGAKPDEIEVTMLPGDAPRGVRFEIERGAVLAVQLPVMGSEVARFVRRSGT